MQFHDHETTRQMIMKQLVNFVSMIHEMEQQELRSTFGHLKSFERLA